MLELGVGQIRAPHIPINMAFQHCGVAGSRAGFTGIRPVDEVPSGGILNLYIHNENTLAVIVHQL
jgi:hypothetical protein